MKLITPAVLLLMSMSLQTNNAIAAYVCTGSINPAIISNTWIENVFENGDVKDESCDLDELGIGLDGPNDGQLITKIFVSPKGSVDIPSAGLDVTSGEQDNFGTLAYTGSPSLTFYVDKYSEFYDLYLFDGPINDCWGPLQQCGDGNPTRANQATSHLSGYSAVPIQAAVWLLGTGLLAFIGIKHKRTRA